MTLLLTSSDPVMRETIHTRFQMMVIPTWMKKLGEWLMRALTMLITDRWYVYDHSSRIIRSSGLNVNRHKQCRCCATCCDYTEEGLDDPERELPWPYSVNVVKPRSGSRSVNHRLPMRTQIFGLLHEKTRRAGQEADGDRHFFSASVLPGSYILNTKLPSTMQSGCDGATVVENKRKCG